MVFFHTATFAGFTVRALKFCTVGKGKVLCRHAIPTDGLETYLVGTRYCIGSELDMF